MRRVLMLVAILIFLSGAANAQIGKSVGVAVGTPEDKAIAEIYAAPDSAQKISLLQKFLADYGSNPDLALLANQLFLSVYQTDKNYEKTIEYGEKVLAVDPGNFSAAVTMARAAQEKGDTEQLFAYGQRAADIVQRYKAQPPPGDMPASDWKQKQAETLKATDADLGYLDYSMYSAAYAAQDPKAKIALLEKFVAAFPQSTYAESAEATVAFTYQQLQDTAKMQETAEKILAKNPDNASMLVLLSDYWSSSGKELDKAEADAKKAIEVLGQKKKPDGVTDQQWAQQNDLQKGMALSSLGQVYVNRTKNLQAVEAFKQANPLLKQNDYMYGRNLYRLGFTLAKMRKTPEARAVLAQAIQVKSPFRTLAQQTLDKIGGGSQ
ncbi:MAG: tetratricopeptide repeat protein [Candidatus Acidiferrales bacterium]